MASMNLGKESHFHIHLYPADKKEIDQWRKIHNLESGRMLTFLGEKETLVAEFEKRIWKQSFSKSINEAADDLIKDVEILKSIAEEIT